MKSLMQAVVVAAVLAAPVVSFAQSNAPVTRAQVRAELVQLEEAGYHGDTNAGYPDQLQAAEARVAARNGTESAYGGKVVGSSASGAPAAARPAADDGMKPLYFGQ
jgi:Domain of unknown function (DUF4148)